MEQAIETRIREGLIATGRYFNANVEDFELAVARALRNHEMLKHLTAGDRAMLEPFLNSTDAKQIAIGVALCEQFSSLNKMPSEEMHVHTDTEFNE